MNALIIVDVQYDFLPGGALAVPRGNEVIPVIRRLAPRFDLVVATQDWHPADHSSFASRHPSRKPGEVINLNGLPQVLWPDHCVQGTPGAELAPEIASIAPARVIRKGVDPAIDSYSGFFDNDQRRSTGLDAFLRDAGVRDVCVTGLATDYCVRFTALDARRLGFQTTVVTDAVRGVDLAAGDSARALAEMAAVGVRIVSAADVCQSAERARGSRA